MSLVERIRDLLGRLKEAYDFGQDIADLLEELEERLDQYAEAEARGEPEALFLARLLADFIESLGGKMPPVISDFIELYAKALKSGIEYTVYLACIRYWLLRQQGCSHEEAAAAASLSDENAVWCRTLWVLHHLPQVDEDLQPEPAEDSGGAEAGGFDAPPTDEENWLPPPPEPRISEKFFRCCEDGGSDAPVEVDWGTLRIVRSGSHVRLTGEFSVRHPCGIAAASLDLEILDTLTNFFEIGTTAFQDHIEPSSTPTSRSFRLKKDIPLYDGNQPLGHFGFLRVRAVSNCLTVPDPAPAEVSLIG